MIFKIRKDERLFALCALIVFTLFNALLIYNKFDRFTLGERVGFWSVFYNHLNMSGYDVFSLIAVSCLRVHFSTLRHPLYLILLLPVYWVNSRLMAMTGFNSAVFFISLVNIVCATYAAVFFMRTLREAVGVSRSDAMLLTAMLYSFAHVLLATMVPDHFGLSMFMLTLTLYITSVRMLRREHISPLLSGSLFLFTAGITLTNGVKTIIALLFANGRKALAWRHAATIGAAAAVLAAMVAIQNKTILEPQAQQIKKIEDALKKKDPNFGKQFKAHDEWVKQQNGKALDERMPLLKWSDMTTPRLCTVWHNLFGESLQLHRDHLLEDVQQSRPVFVAYGSAANRAVEVAVIAVFVIGVWYGRRSRLLWLALSWFAFDMLMHIGLGFGINEVYIMTAHWAFVIPLAAAYAIAHSNRHTAVTARCTVALLTVWMWAYNGWLIADYLI